MLKRLIGSKRSLNHVRCIAHNNGHVENDIQDRLNDMFFYPIVINCCNGHLSRSFSDADMDLSYVHGRVPVSEFLLNSNVKTRSTASGCLDDYLTENGTHEKRLYCATKIKDEVSVAAIMAEHLFSKLMPGDSYILDNHGSQKYFDSDATCPCSCGAFIPYGNTGAGNTDVWHGFLDIIFGSSTFVKVITEEEDEVDDYEYYTEKEHEKSIFHQKTLFQAISQTIVLSHILQNKTRSKHIDLVSGIVASSSKFYILVYDSKNDILLKSFVFYFWDRTKSPPTLQTPSLYALWTFLNYRALGLRINHLYNVIPKAGFQTHTKNVKNIYRSDLKIGCSRFCTVKSSQMPQHINELDESCVKMYSQKMENG